MTGKTIAAIGVAVALVSSAFALPHLVRAVRPAILPAAPAPLPPSLEDIDDRGVLRVALPSNSTTWFLHRGRPMGFQYDLLTAFAEDHGWTLDVTRTRSHLASCELLERGEVDMVGGRLLHGWLPCPSRPTADLYQAEPVLVQPRDLPVETLDDLGGQEVWTRQRTAWVGMLVRLQSTVGPIHIVEVDPSVPAEELVRRVAAGSTPTTVAPRQLALLEQAFVGDEVAVRPELGPAVPIVPAVEPGAEELSEAFTTWIGTNDTLRRQLYNRYFFAPRYAERAEEAEALGPGRASDYDTLLRRGAAIVGWDWRLLAAQAHQESRFDPHARSWAGAEGLLQLMPATARSLGVTDRTDAEQNVMGAARYLLRLQARFEPTVDPAALTDVVLAAYNVGPGHMEDAMRLAEHHGEDPTSWPVIARWLLRKEDPRYYRLPFVEHGYARGSEPVEYVERIRARYDSYEHLLAP